MYFKDIADSYAPSDVVSSAPNDTTNDLSFLVDLEGQRFVLKHFLSSRAHRRELSALQTWGRSLSFAVPEVVHSLEDGQGAILMTHLDGDRVQLDTLEPAGWYRFGSMLKEIHSIEAPSDDSLPLVDATRQRIDSAIADASSWMSQEERTQLERLKIVAAELPSRERVYCHGDYVPRNWLQAPANFSVVDFENARPNVLESDFVKLELEVWRDRPAMRDDFMSGYGEIHSGGFKEWLRIQTILYTVGTVNWSFKRGMENDAAKARDLLASLY